MIFVVHKIISWFFQGHLRKVYLTSKDVLDHVVSYLGFHKAKYTNGPDGNSGVNGEVKFKVPYMKNVKYCGTITIKGKGKTLEQAEEDAAYKALLFIEDSYNINIVDFNH